MGLKTAGVGHFTIPTAPAAGTSVTSGAANTFTTTYVVLSASTPAALFITGIHLEAAAAKAATYIVVQLATGTAGSEAVVGQYLVPLSTASTVALGYRQIYPPILVANGTRVAAKTADSVGAAATLVTLECINQANVVDDGVVVGTVSTVSAVTGLTASNLDAAVSTRMATYTQPTGFLAATFPTTVASPTNITAASGVALAASQHVIVDSGTVTTLTNLPAITAGWLTATGIAASALNGKGDWPVGKTGYSLTTADWAKAGDAMTLTVAYDAAKTALAASSYTTPPTAAAIRSEIDANSTGLAAIFARTDVATSTRLASASYTAPDNATIGTTGTAVAAIKAKTDSLTFTVAGKLDGNVAAINGVAILGDGSASPFHI